MPFFDKDGNEIQLGADTPEVKELLDAAISEATSGLAANKEEILAEKKKLQEQISTLSEQWKGLDPEAVRGIMDRLENDEEMKLLAEGKADEVVERRTQRLKQDYEKKMQGLQEQLEALNGKLEGAHGEVKRLKVESGLRSAAAELNLYPSAIEDALARAMGVFKVNEQGELYAEDATGTVFGPDGRTPMTPADWLKEIKPQAGHWFRDQEGRGTRGGERQGGQGQFTMTRSEAKDTMAYQALRAEAQKAGQHVQIVDDK